MVAALEVGGNASSVHAEGRAARRFIEDARAAVAALVGAQAKNVTFTSGGTEANVLALTPALGSVLRTHLLVSAIEHPAVLAGYRFPPSAVRVIRVRPDGVVDLANLDAQLAALTAAAPAAAGEARALVSVMAANNETGVMQPIRQIADLVHAAGGLLHVDSVQAAGRVPLAIEDLGADLLTLSAHKIGGPQGAGALVRRENSLAIAEPVLRGGRQERGLRAGTENVAASAGFGAAALEAKEMLARETDRLLALRTRLEDGLRALAPETVVFGAGVERVPNTTLFAVPGIKAEIALMALDLDGIAVSSGSACSSGKLAPSHVLAAMGVEESLARGAIRVSVGFSTSEAEIERFLHAWKKRVDALRKGHGTMAA